MPLLKTHNILQRITTVDKNTRARHTPDRSDRPHRRERREARGKGAGSAARGGRGGVGNKITDNAQNQSKAASATHLHPHAVQVH